MEHHTAVNMIQLQLYTTTQSKTGQISSILFKEINLKGMIYLKIKTVVTLKGGTGNALVVQWLGLSAFTAVAQGQSLVGELRSLKQHGTAKK